MRVSARLMGRARAFSLMTILLEALTRAVEFVYDNTSKVMRLVVAGTDTATQDERAELIR